MPPRTSPLLDDVPALALLLDVVAAGSFSRAARRRGLTTSAVSKRIAQLEARLGLQLLTRSTRHLAATDAGRRLLARAERLMGELSDAEKELADLAHGPRGVLRVATSVGLAQSHVGRIVTAFVARHPEVSVELSADERLVDLVEGRYDLGVRCGTMRDSSLTVKKLARASRVLCAAPAYLEAHGTPEHANDLRRHVCLRHVLDASGATWKLGNGPRTVEVPVGGTFHADNPLVLRDAAVAGAGIAFLPSFVIADDVRAGRLRVVLEGHAAETGWVYLAFPGTRPSKLARAFADFASARIVEALA